MISIQNMGPYDDPDHGGKRTYEVKIHGHYGIVTKICSFEHYRRDGLATCLRLASEAVLNSERNNRHEKN